MRTLSPSRRSAADRRSPSEQPPEAKGRVTELRPKPKRSLNDAAHKLGR
jgi:hypothetical protein